MYVCVYMYIYIYVCMYVCVCILYIYIYIYINISIITIIGLVPNAVGRDLQAGLAIHGMKCYAIKEYQQ